MNSPNKLLVATSSGADTDTANHVESAWSKLKGPLLDADTEVCVLSKNHQWKPETRWWNEEVDKAIQKKHAWFKVYSALKGVANMPSGCQSLRRRKRDLPQYPQMVMMFSVSPNRWTTETRTLLVRTVYTMMLISLRSLAKTRWRHGLNIMLGCSMMNLSVAKQRAPWGPPQLLCSW